MQDYQVNIFKNNGYVLLKLLALFLRLGLRNYRYKITERRRGFYTILIDNSDIRDIRQFLGTMTEIYVLRNHVFLTQFKLNFKPKFDSFSLNHYASFTKICYNNRLMNFEAAFYRRNKYLLACQKLGYRMKKWW
jgi:hypothetical protein